MIKRSVLILLLFLTIRIAPIYSNDAKTPADPKITVSSEIDHAFFTIGDQVKYRITIRHPIAIKVLDIDTQKTLRDFEVKGQERFSDPLDHDLISEGKTVSITSFSIGEYVLPPAAITYQDSSGNTQTLDSNKLYVSVESVNKSGESSDDIRGVKGVVGFRNQNLRWFLAGIGLLGIAFLAWWFYQRKITSFLLQANATLLSAHEEAYQELNRLIDSDLLQRMQYKLYFSKISEIIRHYLERRYQILALESTTKELLDRLRALTLEPNSRMIILETLESCDLVKFAKYLPSATEVLEIDRKAKEIIDLTREAEQPTASPTAQDLTAASRCVHDSF